MADPRPRRVYLHIGAPKTGTTYLQAILAKNRDRLAAHGVLYPPSQGDAHHKAAWDLRGTPPQREGAVGVEGRWQQLVDDADAAPGDVVVSTEHLVFAKKPEIKRAATSFAAEVHVVYTARDLQRQVPAVWQERLKNQESLRYRDFVAAVMASSTPRAKAFWNVQDPAAVLERWSRDLPADRMHLVTAPPSGQPFRVLWDRFATAVGLVGTDYDVEVDGSSNLSLRMVQAELLRRFNEKHAEGLTWNQYRRLMFRQIDVLRAVKDDRRVGLTDAERAFFARRGDEIATAVTARGYQVVGDLTDLASSAGAGGGGETDVNPTDAELFDASLDVMRELLDRQADAKVALRDLRRGQGQGQGHGSAGNAGDR